MNNSKRIYVAGPMTGLDEHNFAAFHTAAKRLRQAGWDVVNPAENFEGRTDLPREQYIRADVMMLANCDVVAMLPGWQESCGAKLEYLLATEMGMDVLDAETLEPLTDMKASVLLCSSDQFLKAVFAPIPGVLDEAKRLTDTDRQDDYGHPREDFKRTARMWNGILAGKLRDGAEIAATDVPLCMIAVKLARQTHRHKRDNLVDIAGYARTAAMLAGEG